MTRYPQRHIDDGLKFTTIKKIDNSPLKYYHEYVLENWPPKKAVLNTGSVFHLATLQPDLLKAKVAIEPEVNKRTKAGKLEIEVFNAVNKDKIIISQKDYNTALGMSERLKNNDDFNKLLGSATLIEENLYGEDPETGQKLRITPDAICANGTIVLDLKSTQDASEEGFSKAISSFSYNLEAALFVDIARQNGYDIEYFIFAVVESKPPYCEALYFLDEESIEKGRETYKYVCWLFNQCVKTNNWPAYHSGIKSISMPRWALQKNITYKG
jgi:exodeoxyribonuclease VIII